MNVGVRWVLSLVIAFILAIVWLLMSSTPAIAQRCSIVAQRVISFKSQPLDPGTFASRLERHRR